MWQWGLVIFEKVCYNVVNYEKEEKTYVKHDGLRKR